MAREIERKFLVAGEGWRAGVSRTVQMRQAYLGGERCSVRVRISGGNAWLNIKSREAGVSREEYEYPIPLHDAEALFGLALPGAIEKRRHYVPGAFGTWEIDEFLGENAGLVLAEIELESEDAQYERPDWLGAEVTDDTRYYNAWLAGHPYRTWKD